MSHVLVIGGAGFIGSHLVEHLLSLGAVRVFDNLSSGRLEFLNAVRTSQRLEFCQGDILDPPALKRAMAGIATVFHLAANPEARRGLEHPRLDLEQGTIGTSNVLEAMREQGCSKLVFTSSGTVYGDTGESCREDAIRSLPVSLYGASKLSSEALIHAHVACFELRAWVFRLGNVVGPRATHGVLRDLLTQLGQRPTELYVLGDGEQQRPYLHVEDCVAGIGFALDRAQESFNLFNLAPHDQTRVSKIVEMCIAASPHKPQTIRYRGGRSGWPGDVPVSRLNPEKLQSLGYRVPRTSDRALEKAIAELAAEVFG